MTAKVVRIEVCAPYKGLSFVQSFAEASDITEERLNHIGRELLELLFFAYREHDIYERPIQNVTLEVKISERPMVKR